MTLIETVNQTFERRAALVAELAALDAELEEIRQILGVVVTVPPPAAPEAATASARSNFEVFDRSKAEKPHVMSQPELLSARDAAILSRLRGGPASKAHLVDALPLEPGKDEQQRYNDCANALTRLRREGRIVPSPDGWLLATAPQQKEASVSTAAPPPVDAPAPPLRSHAVPAERIVPERRCGRCCHKFRPTTLGQYVCDGCADKPRRIRAEPPEPELERIENSDVGWRPVVAEQRTEEPLSVPLARRGQVMPTQTSPRSNQL